MRATVPTVQAPLTTAPIPRMSPPITDQTVTGNSWASRVKAVVNVSRVNPPATHSQQYAIAINRSGERRWRRSSNATTVQVFPR